VLFSASPQNSLMKFQALYETVLFHRFRLPLSLPYGQQRGFYLLQLRAAHYYQRRVQAQSPTNCARALPTRDALHRNFLKISKFSYSVYVLVLRFSTSYFTL